MLIPDDLIPINEAAKLLRVNRCTIFRWCRCRKLPSWKVGGRRRVRRADVLAMVEVCDGPSPEVQARWEAEERARRTREVLAAHGLA